MAAARSIPIRGGFPSPPGHLKEQGKAAWESGLQLWAEGVISQRDIFSWQLYCEAFDEKAHCEMLVKKQGEYQMSPNGCYAQHPAIKRRQQAEATIRKYSVAFGLVPDARKKRAAVQQGVASRKR
jgi:P27 family predicted phage terminase small subunit